ncbi:hypothetical protein LCGC14_0174880 [marine sediment metagenome]|uniref:tRNA intron endonuclease catalytic domain-containing protein n=1 Tax=marine sediment metagenome TaxID=412755 RepID=A0A0F9UV49_9ZZZZ
MKTRKRILTSPKGKKRTIDVNSGTKKPIRKSNLLPPQYTINMTQPTGKNRILVNRGEVPYSDIMFHKDQKNSSSLIVKRKYRKKFISAGIIGEPVGLGVRKKDRQFDKNPTNFTVSPYDMMYANEIGLLDPETMSRRQVTRELERWGLRQDPAFFNKYSSYKKLRDNGFIVMSGLQYGVDFVAYDLTPTEFTSKEMKKHSKYMIDIMDEPTLHMSNIIKGLEEAKEINKEYILMQAGDTKLSKRYLDRPTDKIRFYAIDAEALLVDNEYDLDAVIMRRIKQSKTYRTFPVEIRDTYVELDDDE